LLLKFSDHGEFGDDDRGGDELGGNSNLKVK